MTGRNAHHGDIAPVVYRVAGESHDIHRSGLAAAFQQRRPVCDKVMDFPKPFREPLFQAVHAIVHVVQPIVVEDVEDKEEEK